MTYNMPTLKRGLQVFVPTWGGVTGKVTSAKYGQVMVRLPGERVSRIYHPDDIGLSGHGSSVNDIKAEDIIPNQLRF